MCRDAVVGNCWQNFLVNPSFVESLPIAHTDGELILSNRINCAVIAYLMVSAFERNYIEKAFAKSMHHKDRNIICILLA